jgi:N-acetylglutamate synthase/N-acetylornithine aminotransferase
MEVSGAYNSITNLMDLVAKKSEETAAEEAKSGKTNASKDASAEQAKGDAVYLSKTSGGLGSVAANLSTGTGVLDSLEANEAELREHFLSALNAKFEELGVDTSKHITLKRDADGTVVVANDHPDKEKIEALFKDVPVFEDAFNSMADQSELARQIKSDRAVSFARMGGLAAYMNNSDSSGDDFSFFMSLAEGASSSYFASNN